MAKIYLDPGHGGIDSGAEGCGKRESVQVHYTVSDQYKVITGENYVA